MGSPNPLGLDAGVYTAATEPVPNAIRRFGDADIEGAMRKVLSNLGSGKRGAVVAYADKDGIKGAVYSRRPGKLWFLPAGEWSYVGTLGVTYQGKLEGGAGVMYEW